MVVQKISIKFKYGMAVAAMEIKKVSESIVRLVIVALLTAYLLWLMREILLNQF